MAHRSQRDGADARLTNVINDVDGGALTWLILQRQQATEGTALARAIDYSLKPCSALIRFADDGDLPPDNNYLENRLRPIASGGRIGCSPVRYEADNARPQS